MIAFLVCHPFFAFSNDGAYTMSGNHLIPINDKSISIKKEHLSIKRILEKKGDYFEDYYEVNVYYEFFNPNAPKKLIVGFEAQSPSGGVGIAPVNRGHPYMSDFTVMMNGDVLDHDIAYVADSTYYNAGVVRSVSLESFLNNIAENDEMFSDFYYVYHFNAFFKTGVNAIHHTYRFTPSSSNVQYSVFDYVLTSINSWGDGKVGDFTMVIDAGDFASFGIDQSFFNSSADWFVSGIGNVQSTNSRADDNTTNRGWLSVNIRSGVLVFNRTNFRPQGELQLVVLPYSIGDLGSEYYSFGDSDESEISLLPFSPEFDVHLSQPRNDFELKLLRNLPYARRGYVFKTPELRAFYEKMEWYIPNPNYVPDGNKLLPSEYAFLNRLKIGN